ncbi:MAG: aminotransferase class III-fold pyridoxal phosphate-dependent enzyme [Anaerolineales bacterium]|nr:aminotransferase class III-fold pyridoxal phosphate-dependent enzyme [Anaerolineales bacterium]
MQGEWRVYPATAEYIQAARRICDERGCIVDRGRNPDGLWATGKMFAIQHFGVTPGSINLCKIIAGGVPMGAVLIGQNVKNSTRGVHGLTLGGIRFVCGQMRHLM